MPRYFAYGSNCDAAVMGRKGVSFASRTRATLGEHRLLFNKRALRKSLPDSIGFANIEPSPEGRVEGILYELTEADLERLDATERYPDHYERIRVSVETEDGPAECWTYRARPDKVADGLVPSRNYLDHILAGGDFLSRQYYESLDSARTYSGTCACCHRESEVLFTREGDHLHTLCQPCREARARWGDVRRRRLTVAETEAVMTRLVLGGEGFPSVQSLVDEAIRRRLIAP